ncbi:hypothetical protein ADL19_20210, partial [Streptomyces purpurogeneiscleroticus]
MREALAPTVGAGIDTVARTVATPDPAGAVYRGIAVLAFASDPAPEMTSHDQPEIDCPPGGVAGTSSSTDCPAITGRARPLLTVGGTPPTAG